MSDQKKDLGRHIANDELTTSHLKAGEVLIKKTLTVTHIQESLTTAHLKQPTQPVSQFPQSKEPPSKPASDKKE